jgi:hypothetical protein
VYAQAEGARLVYCRMNKPHTTRVLFPASNACVLTKLVRAVPGEPRRAQLEGATGVDGSSCDGVWLHLVAPGHGAVHHPEPPGAAAGDTCRGACSMRTLHASLIHCFCAEDVFRRL